MFKQIWLYDGTPILLESIQKYQLKDGTIVDDVPADIEKELEVDGETITDFQQVLYEVINVFDYPKEYTELQPTDGLYQPISFNGKKWIGTKQADWEAANPPEESEGDSTVDDNQEVLEELILQVAALTNANKGDE